MWPFRTKTPSGANDDPPPDRREAVIRGAEILTDDLEQRADRVHESLLDRLRRNTFAEGILVSFIGPSATVHAPQHRRGGS